jgi:hypothetical protein
MKKFIAIGLIFYCINYKANCQILLEPHIGMIGNFNKMLPSASKRRLALGITTYFTTNTKLQPSLGLQYFSIIRTNSFNFNGANWFIINRALDVIPIVIIK